MNTQVVERKAEAKNQKADGRVSKVKRIKNSDTAYEHGGVFEASKFAKGDGWK